MEFQIKMILQVIMLHEKRVPSRLLHSLEDGQLTSPGFLSSGTDLVGRQHETIAASVPTEPC